MPSQSPLRTYDWWDSTLLKAMPIAYVRSEDVEGYNTYVFQQSIDPTVTDTVDVPASVLGENSAATISDTTIVMNNLISRKGDDICKPVASRLWRQPRLRRGCGAKKTRTMARRNVSKQTSAAGRAESVANTKDPRIQA